MFVLDVDTVTLDNMLDDTVECRLKDAEASWLWTMRCCGAETMLCDTHDTKVYHSTHQRLPEPGRYWVCDECGHDFGFQPRFTDMCDRRPI